MKKNNLKILASFILGFFFVFFISTAGVAFSADFFIDNFNNYTIDIPLSSQSHNLYYNYSTSLDRLYPRAGNFLEMNVGGSFGNFITNDFTPTTSTEFFFSFDFKFPHSATWLYPAFFFCNTYDTNHRCYSPNYSMFDSYFYFTNDGKICFTDNYPQNCVSVNWFDGNIHNFVLYFNSSTDLMYFSIDDNQSNTISTSGHFHGTIGGYKAFNFFDYNSASTLFISNLKFSDSLIPPAIDGSCGSANGHSYRALPIDAGVLCSVGTPSGSIFSFDVGWIWTCYGQNGGDDAICNATFDANAQAIDAVCGDDDGQTLSSPPTDFCNSGDLITPSFISTNTGWSWTCAGTDGGQDDFCSAKNTDFIFPDIPAPIDCSAMAVPEKWFCDLTNTLKGIFLPTDDAIKTLNNTIKSVKQKAPFCYITALQNNLAMLQVAKDTDNSTISLTFTLGTNASGDIDLNTFGTTGKLRDLMIFIKAICSFIVILIFIFWALSFTKRIFK